ncbi:MAG: hypothetical protein ACREN7_00315 [Candidatus Dormibacteria bacterium]
MWGIFRRAISGCGCCLMPVLILVAAGTGYFYLGPMAGHWVTQHTPQILHDAHLVATSIHHLARQR